ncbi:20735_t:CDS:2 [Rhizophagus irregularis]|nr:20735_t:CDS:2 [Rhizophagus irregularis]
MSLYDNNTEIIDLAMDIDSDHANSPPPQNSCPKLISSPNSIYIYPIHSYASQRLNSNPLPNPSPESSTSKAIFSSKQSNHVNKYKHKSIQKKLRVGKDNSLKDFIVDDSEIEEEEVAKGSAISVKKCAELILDHKYDDEKLLYLVKWDDSKSDNSWENAQTIYPNAVAYTDPRVLIDWNEEIDDVESIQHNDSDQLIAYVLWKSGLRSMHLLDELHEKAPKKMCKWYSTHLRFLDNKSLQYWY